MKAESSKAQPDTVSAAKADRPGILALIGNTPLVPITRLNPNPKVELWAKLECLNPGGSVKDRIALSMIEHAEQSGELTRSKTILEATSGNTGIGLAMVAAVKGYRVLLVMSEGVSLERRKILSALGAEFLLTPAELGTDGAIEAAYELAAKEPERYYLTDQYNNKANVMAHYHGTAVEIWQQTGGRIDCLVATMGTTGTLMGTSLRLREYNPEIKIIGVEPYLGHRLQGLKNMKEAYQPGIYDRKLLTEKINVEDEAAWEMSRRIGREEGLLVGMSSGAAMYVALETAGRLDSGVVVVLLPDGGERYLSTPLFQVVEDVEAEEASPQFLNSFTRRMEVFKPLDPPRVTMYCCGPTVHVLPHLGLYRRVLVADLIRRTLETAGYQVKQVMNITDLDDKTIEEADRLGMPLGELTQNHAQEFLEDLDTLGVLPAAAYPRTSEHVDSMLALTGRILEGGFAYEKLKSVYFNIAKFAEYGKLSGIDLEKIRLGATVDLDSYEKEDSRDFTLLKRCTLAEIKRGIYWKTEWGNVRPGWHVQCAAMALELLGEQADIHVGGTELLFPHHENEIAICQAVTGKLPANYWLHNGLVLAENRKMSHSAGNAVTLRDLLERGYTGRQVRFFLLSTHYRQPLHFSFEALDSACGSLRRLEEFIRNLRRLTGEAGHDGTVLLVSEFEKGFREALFDDLNMSAALAALFHLVRRVNRRVGRGEIDGEDAKRILLALDGADGVLAVMPREETVAGHKEIEDLVQEREKARQARDFATADRLRADLEARGVTIKDTPDGPRWHHQ
jgi:cysteinyl-tRNA synthetase